MSGPKHGCSSDSTPKSVQSITSSRLRPFVALFAGIVMLGLAADTLSGCNATHLLSDYLLPVWPENLDIRPTYALVAGSGIITVGNAVSLFTSNAPSADPSFIPPSA
ncbi:hypothetical protein E4U24_008502 [Claviceps purpurea]|nr:hypothetical protein E4U24_008502 [Claviceps purpurea]